MNFNTRTSRVFAYPAPADMVPAKLGYLRKGFNGLYGLVEDGLDENPLSGDLFLFVNRNRNRAKILLWDGTHDRHIEKAKPMAGSIPTLLSSLKHIEKNIGRVEGAKHLLKANQKDGFDCPGCAWPDPAHRSTFEFFENGVKAIMDEATLMRATQAFFKKHPISKLINKSDRWLNNTGRISAPIIIREGGDRYEEISWEEAFEIIAEKLNSLDSPDEAIFYTSGRTSNEAAFLYQLLVRRLGTNNLPDCSNLCHESSGVGLSETIGIGKGSVLLDDFEVADCIFVVGQNPGTNHPRMMSALQSAARKGAKIISVNPLAEASLSAFAYPQ